MTFSEEEEKLYDQRFDSLYVAGNDKEPVHSPHFSQSNIDKEVKPTKKSVVAPSVESESDLYFDKMSSLLSEAKAGHEIDPAGKSVVFSSDDDDQQNPAAKSFASFSDDEDPKNPAAKSVASSLDDDEQQNPAAKSVTSSLDDDDQHDPAGKSVASSSDDSGHPFGKKRQFSSRSSDNRCHEMKKRKIMPNKNLKKKLSRATFSFKHRE